MPRSFSDQFLDDLYAQRTGAIVLFFAKIDHPDLATPIRVVSDVVDYVYKGETWTGIPFLLEFISDDEGIPKGQITIQNVDRILGEVITAITTAPHLTLEVLSSDDFDLTSDPRVEAASPVTPEITAKYLRLRNIRVDAATIQADIMSFDPTSNPWPSTRTTKDRTPALYR